MCVSAFHYFFQLKLTKKSKSKTDDKQATPSNPAPLDSGLLQEELQKKIIENAQYASQVNNLISIFGVRLILWSKRSYQDLWGPANFNYMIVLLAGQLNWL